MNKIIEAILAIDPSAQVTVRGDDVENIIWHEATNITNQQILDKLAEFQSEYDSTEYQRLRAPEYPPIGDQLDALFHAGVFPADMAAQLQAVKDKYPNA